MNGYEEHHPKSDIKHSTKQWDSASGLTFWNERSVSEASMPPRKAELALYFLSKHHVLHEVVYSFKKKDQTMLCSSSIIKICFGDHSISTAGHRAERRGKCPYPTWPLPMLPAAPGPGDTTAAHMHHLSSHWIQAGSKQHQEPKTSLQASCSLLLLENSAVFSSLLSQQGQFEVAQHLHSERKNLILP